MVDTLAGELTHVSTVQAWECDSNDHLNVQFFHQRFREAGYLFRQRHGLKGSAMVSTHTRFYRELRVDDVATVLTMPVRDTNGAAFLLHRLTVDGTALSCSSLDRLVDEERELTLQPLADLRQAARRGLPAAQTEPVEDMEVKIAAGVARVTCITHVLPSDMDHADEWRTERLVSSFSNGGQSAWSLIGATTRWLRQRNLGRVVLEMKTDRFASPAAGTVLRQTSHYIELGEKAYRFGHQIEDAVSGTLYAAGQVLSVLMDHDTRKVVPIPHELKAPDAA